MALKIAKKTKVKLKARTVRGDKYILRLFVTGIMPNSANAIYNINKICEEYLKGRYELQIIDIYQQPSLAVAEHIIAIPVLIKKFPLPEERIIGDLSETNLVLECLGLKHK